MRKNNFERFFWSVNARRVHPRMNGVWRFVDTLWDFLCFDLNIIKIRRSNQNKRVFWRDLFHHLDHFIMPICHCCCGCYLFTHTTPSHSLYIRIPCDCAFVFLYIGFGKLIPSKDWGGARICMCALFWINIHFGGVFQYTQLCGICLWIARYLYRASSLSLFLSSYTSCALFS